VFCLSHLLHRRRRRFSAPGPLMLFIYFSLDLRPGTSARLSSSDPLRAKFFYLSCFQLRVLVLKCHSRNNPFFSRWDREFQRLSPSFAPHLSPHLWADSPGSFFDLLFAVPSHFLTLVRFLFFWSLIAP